MSSIEMHPSVTRFVDAFNDQDADTLYAEFADRGTLSDPFQDWVVSVAKIREYNAEVSEYFPNRHLEVDRGLTSSDGTTAIEWTLHVTHKGEFEGLPPTEILSRCPVCQSSM